jgi:hypothetical protein
MKRRLDNRLYYFTVEDESLLGEAFPRFEDDVYAIAYKVLGTEDVFVTTADTRDALDRHDVPFNCLAEEDGIRIGLFHSPLSRDELGDYDDALRALALAYRAIGMICVGVNGDTITDITEGTRNYSYFAAPAGHTFLWRLIFQREEAAAFVEEHHGDDPAAREWASTLPLASSEELVSYH